MDGRLGDEEGCSDGTLGDADGGECFDTVDSLMVEEGVTQALAFGVVAFEDIAGVLVIIGGGIDFEVLDSVIGFDAVFVVYPHTIGDGAEEGGGY